jgi:spore coat protein U-like protein
LEAVATFLKEKIMKHFALALALVVLAAVPSFAADQVVSETNTDNIKAEVKAACSVETFNIDFGDYYATEEDNTEASGTFNVTCSNLHSYTVSLSKEAGDMTNGTDDLSYTLDLVPPTGGGIGIGAAQQYTVDGTIVTGQFVSTGSYVDTVYVEVDF